MKIVFALHHFLPEFIGGTEIYVSNLAKQILQKGNEVVVIIPNLGINTTEEYFHEGIRVIKYAENSIEDRAMIMGKKKPDGLQEFSRIIKKENPTHVHFHELAPGRGINIFHVKEVHQLRIPVVITFHVPFYSCLRGTLLHKGKQKCDGEIIIKRCTACMYQQKNITGTKAFILNRIAMGLFHLNIDATGLNTSVGTALGFPFVIDKMKKDLLRLSDLAEKIVVIADWYKEILLRNNVPEHKMVFIKQGLPNVAIRKPVKSSFTTQLRVVYIGRITEPKGLHLLIDAVLKINPVKIHLDIYGPETNDPYVLACKEKSGAYKNINWKGIINSSEVIDTLSKYHILCLPSAFEMSSLVIQEAFAAGIPVIASDVYGNAEQVKEDITGWLFRFKDSNHLALKLQMLINDPGKLEAVKQYLPNIITFKDVAARHLELYSQIIANQKNANEGTETYRS